MTLGNVFLHGMMHGIFDGTLAMPFSRALWCINPCGMFSNFLYFTPMSFPAVSPYFSIFTDMPSLPAHNLKGKTDYSDFWENLPEQQYQYDYPTDMFVYKKNEDSCKRETKSKESTINDNKTFRKMLNFVLEKEGGYVSNDCGQAGNMGVLQSTYDEYRKNNGLPVQNVKELTLQEAEDIYYNMYYKASGADKIKDSKLAFQVFDTAVNMGVSAAKKLLEQSGGDFARYEELRLERYETIAQKNADKAQYLTGWKNRVDSLELYAETNFTALA